MILSQKDLLELKYWIEAPLLDQAEDHVFQDCRYVQKQLQARYLAEFLGMNTGLPAFPKQNILEIGTGPYWGMLPLIDAELRIAIDPLIDAFDKLGLLEERGDIRYYSEPFELWDPGDLRFDGIFCANALDHGEMDFYLLPKIAHLLKAGGRFYLHVHLRPGGKGGLLNLIHDHSLTEASLKKHLSYTPLRSVRCEIDPTDPISGFECPTLIGIWEKPQ